MNSYAIKTYSFHGSAEPLLELLKEEPYLFLLESSLTDACRGRYSFLGWDPFKVFIASGKNALEQLKEEFIKFEEPQENSPLQTPLPSGIVGFLSYDFGLSQEKIRLQAENDLPLPECVFGFYDCLITIDHLEQKLHIFSSGKPVANEEERWARSLKRLEEAEEKIGHILNSENEYRAEGDTLFKKEDSCAL